MPFWKIKSDCGNELFCIADTAQEAMQKWNQSPLVECPEEIVSIVKVCDNRQFIADKVQEVSRRD